MDNGKTTYYGLWPDRHSEIKSRGLDNGAGTDIRTGIESGIGEVSRYYLIDATQKENFEKFSAAEYYLLTVDVQLCLLCLGYHLCHGRRTNQSPIGQLPEPAHALRAQQ